jgi:hypothetical protein
MDLFAVLPRPDFALLPLAGAVVASGRQQDVLCLGICVVRRGRRRIGACLIARDGGTSQVETRRRRVQARTATSESASAWLACWHGMRAGRGFSRHEHKRDRECKLPVTALFPHLLLHLRQAINVCQIHAQRGRAFVPQFAC